MQSFLAPLISSSRWWRMNQTTRCARVDTTYIIQVSTAYIVWFTLFGSLLEHIVVVWAENGALSVIFVSTGGQCANCSQDPDSAFCWSVVSCWFNIDGHHYCMILRPSKTAGMLLFLHRDPLDGRNTRSFETRKELCVRIFMQAYHFGAYPNTSRFFSNVQLCGLQNR